jgi:thiamine pyrophosphokinase
MHPRAVIVVTGGDDVPPEVVEQLPIGAPVVAADSGVDHALRLGLTVTVAIGDFDSVSASGLAQVTAAGARIVRHPSAKDHTDLELALDEALAQSPTEIVVVGGHGGRLDHLLANALLLALPRAAGVQVSAYWGRARVHALHGGDEIELHGVAGELITLLPVQGPAVGVRTKGLRYPLSTEDLPAATSRGVSNVFEAASATVALDEGALLVVRPGLTEEGAET